LATPRFPAPESHKVKETYTSKMSLKNAAFFALVGMILLTVLLAAVFLRDLLSAIRGVLAAIELLTSAIRLLASLGLTVFLYVFHKNQS
jgi:hypothetical protein